MLEKDIDFGGAKISAVGTASKPFCGYFDGNGHVLKNAVIQNNSYAGLFGYAEDRAQIRDLSAEKITVSGKYAGGIVGEFDAVSIQRCTFSGTVKGTSSAGGIVGKAGGLTLTECASDLAKSSSSNAKAMVGSIDNDAFIMDSNMPVVGITATFLTARSRKRLCLTLQALQLIR